MFNYGKAFPVLRLLRTLIEGHTCLKRAKQRKAAKFVEVVKVDIVSVNIKESP